MVTLKPQPHIISSSALHLLRLSFLRKILQGSEEITAVKPLFYQTKELNSVSAALSAFAAHWTASSGSLSEDPCDEGKMETNIR